MTQHYVDKLLAELNKLRKENLSLKQIIDCQRTADPGLFNLDEYSDTVPFAIQASGLGLWSVDLMSLSVNWSSEMCALLGLRRSKFIVDNARQFTVERFLTYIHPDDRDEVEQEIKLSIAKHLQFNCIFRMRHIKGYYKWLHSIGYTAYLQDGTPVHMTGFVWDVSEYKTAEEHLRKLIVTDELTGLYNRRRMVEVLEHELSYCKRFGNDVSVVSIDVDHFKNINDVYGHEMGDRFLKALAKLMRQSFRDMDYLFRWGGEEFIAILPNVNVQKAQIAAERLRVAFKAINIEGAHTTVSAGIASSAQLNSKEGYKKLLEISDQALYRAKHAGRDRVVCYTRQLQTATI